MESEAIKKGSSRIFGKVFIENVHALKLVHYWGYPIKRDKSLGLESSVWIEKVLISNNP